MTTAMTDTAITAGSVLFGPADAQASVESLFGEHPFLQPVVTANRLTSGVCDALQHEVSTATTNLLQLDLIDLLVRAWRKQADLVAAAQRTAAIPGSSEVVELATHRITSIHRPYIDLLVEDVRIGRIHLELELVFTVKGLLTVVQGGALVAVRCGSCTVDAGLAIERIPVASREATFDLPGQVRLGRGLPLLPERSLP